MERLFAERRQREAMDTTGVLGMMDEFNEFLRSPTVTNTLSMPRSALQKPIPGRTEATPVSRPTAGVGSNSSVTSSIGLGSRLSRRRGLDSLSSTKPSADDSVSSFLSSISSSESRKRRADELDSKANLLLAGVHNSRLENEITGLQSSLKRIKTEQDGEKMKSTAESVRLQREKERMLESVHGEKLKVEKELRMAVEASTAREERLELQLSTAKSESELARELLEEKEEECTRLSDELEQLRQQQLQHTSLVQTELDMLQTEADEWKQRYEESSARVRELLPLEQEVQQLNHDIQHLENESQHQVEEQDVRGRMADQLSKLDELEGRAERLHAENLRLKASHHSSTLLQEKVASLESKLARAEKRAGDFEALQLEHQEMQKQHEQWATLDKAGRPRSPTAITRQLADLQQHQLVFTDRCSTLETRCKLCESRLQYTLAQLGTVEKELIIERESRTVAEENLARKDRLTLFLTKERDGLRHILSSYQSMDNPGTESMDVQLREANTNLDRYQKAVADLEAENESLTSLMSGERLARQQAESTARLSEEQLQAGLKATFQPPVADQAELQSLRLSVRSLEEERDAALAASAAATAAKTEAKTLAEGASPGSLHKVLHFADNPLQRSRDKLKKLQALESASASDEEVRALKDALEEEKKIRQRLEEVGRRKINELRSAYKVFVGWKLDMLRHGHYELRSSFSSSRDDVLRIERNAAGEIGLQPTPLATQMNDLIHEHLEVSASWPCFLAATTLKLAEEAS